MGEHSELIHVLTNLKTTDMKNTNLTAKRTLMLDLMKIGKTLSPYEYAMGLNTSLKTNKIDNYEYYCLMTMFEMYCEVENIKTAF